MQHPNFETRHPLQSDDQERGIDPLQKYNRSKGGSAESSGTITFSESDSTFISYRKEWDELFLNCNYLARIRQKGINGQLRSSRFRSVCWKLYLDVLPEDKSQWINKTKELRAQYEKIKETFTRYFYCTIITDCLYLMLSLWNKFFQDKELRGMIQQDVMRTFPEMQYFQQDAVRNMLTDILFCYARENEQLLYKQGMHELLAPIVFILHCDHQAFQHAMLVLFYSEEMKSLLNPAFHEHDAYAMFSQLMETAEPWFSTFERQVRKCYRSLYCIFNSISEYIPCERLRIIGCCQAWYKHTLVMSYDSAFCIPVVRWVRLLFGREFPLQDLLVVWDALFADSITLDLVDYIFVAMLLYIRDALIASNYQTCLGLLMHYPPIGDIHALLQKALFLRDPKNNPRPVNYQFQQNLDYYKTRGADLMSKTRASAKAAPLNINKVSSSLLSFGRKLIAPAISVSASTISPINSDHHRLLKSESMPVHLSKDVVTGGGAQVSIPVQTVTDIQGQSSKNVSSSPSIESLPGGRDHTASPPLSATKKDSFFNISRSRSHSKTMGKKDSEEDLEAQISFLQGQLNDLEAMCKYCAKMMNLHIGKIQEVILQENLEKEDEVLVSLAGLKQIKDILKGSLRFNQSQLEAEENEEITIADDHYCSSSQKGGDRNGHKGTNRERPFSLRSQQATSESSLNSEGRNSDDYILISQDDDVEQDPEEKKDVTASTAKVPSFPKGVKVTPKPEKEVPPSAVFQDPLMTMASASCSTSGSSPDDDSSNSKDCDFTIVNPMDLS
ncbi:TBCD5 protein, partial [Atractosteus spatula]|nr:TBCD5 protein [Atractosteus spatula]